MSARICRKSLLHSSSVAPRSTGATRNCGSPGLDSPFSSASALSDAASLSLTRWSRFRWRASCSDCLRTRSSSSQIDLASTASKSCNSPWFCFCNSRNRSSAKMRRARPSSNFFFGRDGERGVVLVVDVHCAAVSLVVLLRRLRSGSPCCGARSCRVARRRLVAVARSGRRLRGGRARRAPWEPFEAAPSFLCRGVDAAQQVRALPQLQISRSAASRGEPAIACYREQSRFCLSRFWPRRRCQCESSLGSLRRRTGRSLPGQGNRMGRGARRRTRARRGSGRKHHPSADEPSRRPPTRRDPYAAHHRDARAQVRGCTSQCFVSLILHGRQRPKRCRSAASKRRTRGVKMGCAPSQPKQKPPSPQKRDFREQLVWERSGRKFCEVYELLKDLNSGSFGTVALCRRKADGNRSIERTASAQQPTAREMKASSP